MSGTMTKLIKDLSALPKTPDRDTLIVKAQSGYYSKSSELPWPKEQLRLDLLEARFMDLAQNVVEGRYDQE